MNRRQLLIAAAALPSLTFCARLFAAPASAPRTLLVFLRPEFWRTHRNW